jgi:hypothetical protein
MVLCSAGLILLLFIRLIDCPLCLGLTHEVAPPESSAAGRWKPSRALPHTGRLRAAGDDHLRPDACCPLSKECDERERPALTNVMPV